MTNIRGPLALALCLVALVTAPARPARAAQTPPAAPRLEPLAGLPMSFEPNVGQVDARVSYVARGRGYTVFVTADGAATLALGDESVRLSAEGARPSVRAVPERELPGKVNYLTGNDPEAWRRDVPTYAAVRLVGVYDGVDMVLRGNARRLEYDFVVAPGADPSKIRVRFDGQKAAEPAENGDVALKLARGEIRHLAASVYQDGAAGRRTPVSARTVSDGGGALRFEVGEYDRTRPLVVDPVLDYADFLGGGATTEEVAGVAVDASGASIVVGSTVADDFPTTPGAFDTTYDSLPNREAFFSNFDAFVTKVSADGTTLLYSTYLGGTLEDRATDVAVDASGNAYVVGTTYSPNYPTTPGADAVLNGFSDVFVTKLAANGATLGYSTYLGGAGGDYAAEVAVRSDGGAVVAGSTSSADFPTTAGAYDTTFDGDFGDAFVTRLSPSGTSLVFSTALGGSFSDNAAAVALDASGNVYVAGTTGSADFPATAGAYDTTYDAATVTYDGFVAKLSASGASLSWASYLGGGENDYPEGIAVDAAGAPVVVGVTASSDFPATPGAFQGPSTAVGNGFVTKLAATGASLVFSAPFGGSDADDFSGVALDASGNAYVAGDTSSADFPTTAGAYDRTRDGIGTDAVAFRLSADGSALQLSTFLGGAGDEDQVRIARAPDGTIAVAGTTMSSDFPTTAGAAIGRYRGGADAFVARLSADESALVGATFLAGTHSSAFGVSDDASAVAVDATGAVYVAGGTSAATFPTTPGAAEPDWPAGDLGGNAFVTKIAPDGATVVYSTFLGGTGGDGANAIALGANGEVFVGGGTGSVDFPVTPGAFQTTPGADRPFNNQSDAFVSKLSADGSSLVYSTFVAGSRGETATGIAARADGTAYVTGTTTSSDFPTTPGAYDRTIGGEFDTDGFVAALDPTGASLVYSTYLGGTNSDEPRGVAVDAAGAAYVTGWTFSPDFPTTPGAFDRTLGAGDGNTDGFVTKVAPNGASLAYSTYLGGSDIDDLRGVAVDGAGRAVVTGRTSSADYPTTPGAYDRVYNEDGQTSYGADAAVTVLSADGASLAASTFLGGARSELGTAVALDAGGRVFVTGSAGADFPTTPGAYDRTYNDPDDGSAEDAFVSVLSADLTALDYSTYLGGSGPDDGTAIAVAADGDAVVAGSTWASDFATFGFGVRDRFNAFVARLSTEPFFGADTPGVVTSAGGWFLRNASSPGPADLAFGYGAGGSGVVALSGDWNGDGVDTPGLYVTATGTFFLKNANGAGGADVVFQFGGGGAGVAPVAGDWDGDGIDTVGLYVAATGTFFLKNANAPGGADAAFAFGPAGAGLVALAGDWDGDGVDSVGLYAPPTGTFFLKNANAPGGADLAFAFGPPGLVPVTGDWDGDGADSVGVYAPSTATWFLTNENAPGPADLAFAYGPPNATPLSGDWDGQ